MTTIFTFEDAEKHKLKGDCWLIIHGKVYDVSRFTDEHPGGDDVLLSATGKDATEDFEDIGHSDSAYELMEQFVIGDMDITTLPDKPEVKATSTSDRISFLETISAVLEYIFPLAILALALALWFLRDNQNTAPPS